MDPKPYLDYLDKEMTIMGLLSTFSALAVGLVLNASLGAQRAELERVWTYGHWYLTVGSAWMLIAALLFYRQRSLLAYYYGQIALCAVRDRSGENKDLSGTLDDADGWTTWFYYRVGFGWLTGGFLNYGLALLTITATMLRPRWVKIAAPLIEIVIIALYTVAIRRLLRWRDQHPQHGRRGSLLRQIVGVN